MSLEVEVVSDGRGPVAGASVRAGAQEVRADSSGVAHFELEPASYAVTVSAEAHAPRRLEVELEGSRTLRVLLSEQVRIRCYVGNFKGKPIEGAKASLTRPSGERASYTSNHRGSFYLDTVLGAVVEVEHPEHGAARRTVDAEAIARGFLGFRLSGAAPAETSASIEGRVLPAREGLTVSARAGRHGLAYSGMTDAQGRFRVVLAKDESYTVEARLEGQVARAEEVPAGAREVELRLEPGATLEGRVVFAESGAPVPAFTVRWAEKDGRPGSRRFFEPRGGFRIEGLSSGSYRVEAEAPGQGVGRLDEVFLPPAGTERVELRLEAPGVIEGRVLDEDSGDPVVGAHVALDGDSGLGRGPSARTGEDGAFRLGGVPPGRRSLSVRAEGYRTRIMSALHPGPGETVGPIEVQLSPSENGGFDLVGIGAVMSIADDGMAIGRTVPGGGAAEAGLGPGAKVLAVDGRPISELGFDGAIQAIRGRVGTTVQLTIEVEGRTRVVTILRRRVAT